MFTFHPAIVKCIYALSKIKLSSFPKTSKSVSLTIRDYLKIRCKVKKKKQLREISLDKLLSRYSRFIIKKQVVTSNWEITSRLVQSLISEIFKPETILRFALCKHFASVLRLKTSMFVNNLFFLLCCSVLLVDTTGQHRAAGFRL